jgi:hypothetical protein
MRHMAHDTADDDVIQIMRELNRDGLIDPRARLRARLTDELATLEAAVRGGHHPANFERERDRLTVELRDLKIPLPAHVRAEVRRSIERMRAAQDGTWAKIIKQSSATYEKLTGKPLLRPKISDFRKAAKAGRKVAITPAARQAVREWESIRQEPPERANAFHYRCASEAFDLMLLFSKRLPSSYEDGPLVAIAVLLCTAAGGRVNAPGMRRTCGLVLRERRLVLRELRERRLTLRERRHGSTSSKRAQNFSKA